jgi:hypothetical protein
LRVPETSLQLARESAGLAVRAGKSGLIDLGSAIVVVEVEIPFRAFAVSLGRLPLSLGGAPLQSSHLLFGQLSLPPRLLSIQLFKFRRLRVVSSC